MARKKNPAANYGIQADSVQAEVLAVGEGARAIKYVTVSGAGRVELAQSFQALRDVLERRIANPETRRMVEADVHQLEAAVSAKQVDAQQAGSLLKSIVDKVRAFGLLTTELAALTTPIKTIASVIGIPLKALGLL